MLDLDTYTEILMPKKPPSLSEVIDPEVSDPDYYCYITVSFFSSMQNSLFKGHQI